jgi:excinuclease ABC subunit C
MGEKERKTICVNMIPLQNIPTNPGVYIYKNLRNEIIYIGKAKNLKKRVSNYFSSKNHSLKTTLLVKQIADIDHIIVDNEVEALLLENKLIKQHKPKYNILLKDSKTYAYILITNEKYPRIMSTRKVGKKGKYFGPYIGGASRREVIELCVKIFQLRICRNLPKRACLNYHISLCSAPCVLNVNEKQYAEQVTQAMQFLKGDTKPIIEKLSQEMQTASNHQQFELARVKRDQLNAIKILGDKQKVDLTKTFDQSIVSYVANEDKCAISLFSITKGVISGKKDYVLDKDEELLADFIRMYYSSHEIPREIIISQPCWANSEDKNILIQYLEKLRGGPVRFILPERGEKKALIELAKKNALHKLDNKILWEMKQLLNLPRVPHVIECFDMSNLGYDYLVGGMVQYLDGKPNKEEYRKFEIRSNLATQDDFASMKEVISRRYKRLRDEEKSMPDLIIVDGGKGQLSTAMQALKELGLQIPIIGLAKREEEIFFPTESEPRIFRNNSSMMLLIRQIRDSVHRFVITYNRKKREMRFKEEI